MDEFKERKQGLLFYFLAFLLCVLIAFESYVISRFGMDAELNMFVDAIGVMTVLQILVAVFLVTLSKSGYYLAVILFFS